MKQQKDSSNIFTGYEGNPKFQSDQLSKILNLDSYYSYVSIILSHPDDQLLLDKVLPLVMAELSKVFPFVIVRSAALHNIEIVLVSVNSFDQISKDLYAVRCVLNYYYSGATLN